MLIPYTLKAHHAADSDTANSRHPQASSGGINHVNTDLHPGKSNRNSLLDSSSYDEDEEKKDDGTTCDKGTDRHNHNDMYCKKVTTRSSMWKKALKKPETTKP